MFYQNTEIVYVKCQIRGMQEHKGGLGDGTEGEKTPLNIMKPWPESRIRGIKKSTYRSKYLDVIIILSPGYKLNCLY